MTDLASRPGSIDVWSLSSRFSLCKMGIIVFRLKIVRRQKGMYVKCLLREMCK